ncbi:MAG: hypothetical protein OXFUSZZB_002549 [Candidatus Fervidibacter sp.]|jgi:predicted dehydrogenase
MATREVGVGLVGYAFMGKAHSNAWRQVVHFFDPPITPRMVAICGRSEERVKAAAEKLGWSSYETDWRKLVRRDDIHIVDVSTANDTHAPISIEAAKQGKQVFCEKPLARNLREAERMLDAVVAAGVTHGVCFNYRRAPAVQLAKQLIASGRMGKVFHFRGTYLQDWIVDPNFPLVWRLRKSIAGSGALGDLAAHVIDLARFLVGEIVEVVGYLHTFIKQRPLPAEEVGGLTGRAGQQMGEVDVDDASLSIVIFDNGAIGYIEATRFAPGRKNYNRFEINCENGSLVFNLERMNELEVYFRDDAPEVHGFHQVMVTEPGAHKYIAAWWPPGHIIGYEHTFVHTVYDFLRGVAGEEYFEPDFYDGVQCQRVLDAIERSAQKRKWVTVEVLPEIQERRKKAALPAAASPRRRR